MVVAVAVVFAAVMALPAQETASGFDALQDSDVLAAMINTSRDTFELIDVRTPREFVGGHIPTADNIEYQVIGQALAETDRDRPIVLYCRTGNRSAQAARTLRNAGFTTVVDFGGVNRWRGSLVR